MLDLLGNFGLDFLPDIGEEPLGFYLCSSIIPHVLDEFIRPFHCLITSFGTAFSDKFAQFFKVLDESLDFILAAVHLYGLLTITDRAGFPCWHTGRSCGRLGKSG